MPEENVLKDCSAAVQNAPAPSASLSSTEAQQHLATFRQELHLLQQACESTQPLRQLGAESAGLTSASVTIKSVR